MATKTTQGVKEGRAMWPPTADDSKRSAPIGGLTPVVVPEHQISELGKPTAARKSAMKATAMGAAISATKAAVKHAVKAAPKGGTKAGPKA